MKKAAVITAWLGGTLVLCLLAIKVFAGSSSDLNLVPLPQTVVRLKGSFTVGEKTRILADKTAEKTAQYLAQRLRPSSGLALPLEVHPSVEKPGRNTILLTTQGARADLGPEGYQLEATSGSVVIRAPTTAGLFFGVQTLLQLLPPEVFRSAPAQGVQWTLPCVRVEDVPRFAWRGMLLDVARHFFSKAELKQVIDSITLHKMNRLQLHLTDDQGWRLEIKRYPRLTEIGGWRKSIAFNLDPRSSTAYGPDGRYGGFYTQDDIREIIAYAETRHVTIVPELEMPGHASAALAAYPQYSCSGGPYSTDMSAGVFAGVYCAGNEATYEFIAGVLKEVSALFPGKYIHIGGDEVTKENWHGCAKCQDLMRRENLKTEHELQSYFVRRVEKILNANGKQLIGWSEIREGGLAQNATVMDWIGGAVEAASAGHDVIMTPTSHCYFDYYQSRGRTNEPAAIGGFIPLQTVYAFEPVPPKLDPQCAKHILGTQGNLWTEYIPSLKHAQYMTFPRLCALAEVAWSPKQSRAWDDFVHRLGAHIRRLDACGINYRKGFFEQ